MARPSRQTLDRRSMRVYRQRRRRTMTVTLAVDALALPMVDDTASVRP